MLANPLSSDPADVQRRADVRQRNVDFNDVLNSVCANYVHCKFDDYLGFNTAFTPAHVSTIDYFHPSVAGQALIAQLAWDAVLPEFCASAPWFVPVGDTDCDGTVTGDVNSGELFIGTDPNDACADTAMLFDERGPAFGEPLSPWVYDTNDDGKATLSDVLAVSPSFNKIKPDPDYDPRFDWNTDDRVTLSDVLSISPYFNKFCYDFFDRLP